MSVIDVVDSNDFKNSTSTGFAIVDYSAVWCGPCKRVEPVFKELAQNNKKIKFLHIDIDHASETEGLSDVVNKIRSVPTFHFYRDGKIIDVLSGGNIAQLKSKVDSLSLLVAATYQQQQQQQQQQQEKQKQEEQKQEDLKPIGGSASAAIVPAAAQATVIDINSFDEFKNYLLTGLAVVDYSATWCGPCKRLEPMFKEMAQQNKNIKFLHIDIDHASETEGLNRLVGAIRSVPTFHFYRDGKVVDTLSGANVIQLKNKIEYLNSLGGPSNTNNNNNNMTANELLKMEEKKREKTYEDKQQDDKIEKKKVKTSENENDDKKERLKSKSPEHYKEQQQQQQQQQQQLQQQQQQHQQRGVRDTSRKREKTVDDKKNEHHHHINHPHPHHIPEQTSGNVIEIEDSIELINKTQSGLAVIDYSATWCGPCKIVAPVYRDLAQHYRAIKFLHIDIDHAAETEGLSELVDKIRSVPTFHFYRDGKIIDFLYGGNISQLKIKVDALNTLGAMAAAAAAANEKKSAMIANAAAITAATNAVIAAATASAPLQPKIIEQKQQQQQLPPPQLAPPQEDNKQKLAIPLVIPSDDSKLATSAPGSVASSAAVTPAITNTTTTTTTTNATTETTTTINNEQTNNLNPIIDIYNSIDFINVTSNGLALVDYSAVWCPPCVRVQPILKDIAQNYKNIKFVHIDIDHAADTDLAELVDKISSVPTFHFYSEGRVIDSLQGANIAQLRSKVETLSNLNTNAANNLIQPFSNAKIGSDNNNNNNNLTTTTNNNEKKEKKKSKSSDEKKAADKKKKRKSKRKEKEAAAAKSQANNTSVGPITTNNNNKSQGDATSAATLVSITTNTAKDIVE